MRFEYPQDYFEDEIRDGFYVNGFMKRCWAAQMEVLTDIDRVCEKYGIKWYADCGTLLGAVRHGGFIPWDDDVSRGLYEISFRSRKGNEKYIQWIYYP